MLSIGEFSNVGHISVRMLRHYDKIGLLQPAHVDAFTGYRYYEWEQLQALSRIQMLKGYKFPLMRIKELLALPEPELQHELHRKKIELYQEKALFDAMLRRLEDSTHQMEWKPQHAQEVTLVELPPQRVYGITKKIHIGQANETFAELYSAAEELGLTRAGAMIMRYLGAEFNYDDMDVEICVPVSDEHPDTHILPGGLHVRTLVVGPYDLLQSGYNAIGEWFDKHPEYEVAGPSFERYTKDDMDGVPTEQLETEILFPVRLA